MGNELGRVWLAGSRVLKRIYGLRLMKSFSLERLPEGDIRTAPGPGDGRGARRGGATADGGHARFVSGSPHWFSLLAMLFLGFAAVSQVAAGTWTPLGNRAPDNIDTMLLLTDGTVMALSGEPASGAIGNAVYKLTPDIHGSYVNGTWSTLASMHDTRLYFSSAVLVGRQGFRRRRRIWDGRLQRGEGGMTPWRTRGHPFRIQASFFRTRGV